MTHNQSDPEPTEAEVSPPLEEAQSAEPRPVEVLAAAVGGRPEPINRTEKVRVKVADWRHALTTARDQFGLVFISWLSATDWANETAVGEDYQDPVEERYELLCALADLDEGRLVLFATDLDKSSPQVDSISDLFPGANWHERETAEMFGINFAGHPDLTKLYLPDDFEGFPLRKTFPLLSREVKPWPGTVDVEDIPPSLENPET